MCWPKSENRRDEFEAKRHVPRDMIEQLKQLGVYRAHAPQCFGGDGSSPSEFLKLIENISEADGSAGWVASFGSAAVYLAALPRETLARNLRKWTGRSLRRRPISGPTCREGEGG